MGAVSIYEKMISLGDVEVYETLGGLFLEGKLIERDIAYGYHYYNLGQSIIILCRCFISAY